MKIIIIIKPTKIKVLRKKYKFLNLEKLYKIMKIKMINYNNRLQFKKIKFRKKIIKLKI